MTHYVAMVPSEGLSGGIEAYVAGVLDVLDAQGHETTVVPYVQGGVGRMGQTRMKASLVRRLLAAITSVRRRERRQIRLLVFHPSFAPPAWVAARFYRLSTPVVFLYGVDIWGMKRRGSMFLRATRSQLVTISSFSAGAAAKLGPARLLHPGLTRARFDRFNAVGLRRIAGSANEGHEQPHHLTILTVFRLDDAESKGLPTLVRACWELRALHGHPIRLVVAGAGRIPSESFQRLSNMEWISILESPDDELLAQTYADSDVFVLATRFVTDRDHLSGEGFGIVLIEAALAALPVIAPALGGSHDAFVERWSGSAAVDESHRSLVERLRHYVENPELRVKHGHFGHLWASSAFAPDQYAARVNEVLGVRGPAGG